MLKNYRRYPQTSPFLYDEKKRLNMKINLLNQLIFNKQMSFSNFVSQNVFNKLIHSKNVCIIGNGPIRCNISDLMDSFDFVIRFNNYYKDNDFDLFGNNIDLHITCIPNINPKVLDSWIIDNHTPVVPFEICNPQRYSVLNDPSLHDKVTIPCVSYIQHILRLRCDCTRGFYGLSVCLQAKYLHNSKMNI